REDAESWRNFFRYLKQRGLEHVRLIVSGKAPGVLEAIGDVFPKSRWQRCEPGQRTT
ncbi:MAG: transposase, partial [Desulfovibrionaceae bacterium]|nr:transposase [Desulfovibrionaceae bacterium]